MGLEHVSMMKKFIWTCLALQVAFGIFFLLLVRYGESADARHIQNQIHDKSHDEDLEENLEKYPLILDIYMMLIGGFGFLMTFLKRHGFSSLGYAFIITTLVTEWTIIMRGFLHMDDTYTIHLTFLEVIEGGLAAAAVLITLGAVLGKLNPFQILMLSLLETPVFVLNLYLGYSILGCVDVGGAIFVHAFGAYFGLAVSMVHRRRKTESSEHLEGSRYTTDIFAMIGTVLLWVYWPSFNGLLASDDARHRAYINTYISLIASTLATFVISAMCGGHNKFDIVDVQNASLSGGVAVGAIADLMIQPYGAFFMGSICGVVSTLGYRLLQEKLSTWLKLHDTCGVHNLHGMPGIISGLASIFMVLFATEDVYGPSLYLLYPALSPEKGDDDLKRIQSLLPGIEPGEGRSPAMQAAFQLIGLFATLVIALITGGVTGLVIDIKSVNTPLHDYELFDDGPFWHLPDDAAEAYKLERNRTDSKFEMNAENPSEEPTLIDNHLMIVNKVYPE